MALVPAQRREPPGFALSCGRGRARVFNDAAWRVGPTPNPPAAPRCWKLLGGPPFCFTCQLSRLAFRLLASSFLHFGWSMRFCSSVFCSMIGPTKRLRKCITAGRLVDCLFYCYRVGVTKQSFDLGCYCPAEYRQVPFGTRLAPSHLQFR